MEGLVTFEELLGKIEELVTKFEMPATDAAAIIFSHWTYSMEQTKLDMQIDSVVELKNAQKDLLASLEKENTKVSKPWI